MTSEVTGDGINDPGDADLVASHDEGSADDLDGPPRQCAEVGE